MTKRLKRSCTCTRTHTLIKTHIVCIGMEGHIKQHTRVLTESENYVPCLDDFVMNNKRNCHTYEVSDMTHSYVRRDLSYMRHDSFICATWVKLVLTPPRSGLFFWKTSAARRLGMQQGHVTHMSRMARITHMTHKPAQLSLPYRRQTSRNATRSRHTHDTYEHITHMTHKSAHPITSIRPPDVLRCNKVMSHTWHIWTHMTHKPAHLSLP